MNVKAGLTAPRVAAFRCPPDKTVALIWDTTVKQLGVRCKRNGKPAYVFQSEIDGKAVRIAIGSPSVWSIPAARDKARELQRLIDEGHDPRELARERKAAQVAKREQERVQGITVGEAWNEYVADRAPHWGERHRLDHERATHAGGIPKIGRPGLTKPGPLAHFMALTLASLTPALVERWAKQEGQTRPTVARLAWRLLKAFLGWCAEHPQHGTVVAGNPAKSKRAREALGKPGVKQDALQREQLPLWFNAVRQQAQPVVAAYLQTLLLTGARPGEIITLQWDDLDFKWRTMSIRDKVEGTRTLPMPPYVTSLLAALPRRNRWVFASPRADRSDEHMTRLDHIHGVICRAAGLEGLTLHGLRRSFGSLTEWTETPSGIVAQIMGHKPSATAEKHYRVRPLDLLRQWHTKIEGWILEQAGIEQPGETDAAQHLRAVA